MQRAAMVRHLRAACKLASRVAAEGRHPFGALLIAPDHETVLLEQGNIDTVNHAESTLAREAFKRFSGDTLARSTLVTTVEPCAMCAGTLYWADIRRLVYGMSEASLLELTGNHNENPTLALPCRTVFGAGQKLITVHGPIVEVEEEIAQIHKTFWKS